MKNIFSKLVLVAFLFSVMGPASAEECKTCKKSSAQRSSVQAKASVCKRAQSTAELNVNNVRALINGYGNMWFDGSISQYHLPKNSNTCPLYCAALWIGGTDVNDQLRIAALSFGSYGDDFWPGPLELNSAYVDLAVCNKYDNHYIITKNDVRNFMSMWDYSGNTPTRTDAYDDSKIAQVIKDWPAHGEGNQSKYLAPFFDANADGVYRWEDGDYPWYDFDNAYCPRTWKEAHPDSTTIDFPTMETQEGIVTGGIISDQVLKGDQTIWWVFNDMGNVHTESDGQPIGLEIRAQAFAFSTNDEINNMTFYSYEIINRSTYTLKDTYFSQWVDPDLGHAKDDYVGCDVKRGLGYCYNGKENDGPGSGSYSGIPPAVGIDFFQGPYMDPDGKDNPKLDMDKIRANPNYWAIANSPKYKDANGQIQMSLLTMDADLFYDDNTGGAWYFKPGDSIGNCAINGVNFGNGIIDDERFGMRRFVYYNNDNSGDNTDPRKATDYYNFLKGKWKNGRRMWYGGDGLRTGTVDNLECDFMFPGDSDPMHWGTNGVVPTSHANDWTEPNCQNPPGDRRFMQSAGPFTLRPGALNYITVGIPFAQAPSGNAWSSVELLREIDDVCQSLFENCFKVLDGPDAPTLVVQEMNNEVILYITYDNPKSNNYGECYEEEDPSIVRTYPDSLRTYKFEGYQIYQLVDANASIADIEDVTKARLVAQCDIENYYDSAKTLPIGTLVNYESNSTTGLLTGQIMVQGANKGIQHVFRVQTDQFATGTNTSLVNNKEYYFICVAYAHNRYKAYSQTESEFLDGQKEPYLAGRMDEHGRSITPVVAIPHDPSSENGGTIAQAEFGLCPNITRLEGHGNGGYNLKLTQASIDALMGPKGTPGMAPGKFVYNSDGSLNSVTNPCLIANPEYEQNAGPVNVRVVNPMSVKEGKFVINIQPVGANDYKWYITNADPTKHVYGNVDTVYSACNVSRYNEQLFPELGIAVSIKNPAALASDLNNDMSGTTNPYRFYGGFVNASSILNSSMSYADVSKQWLTGIPDNDNAMLFNWIRSGVQYSTDAVNVFKNTDGEIVMSETYLDQDFYKRNYSLTLQKDESQGIDKDNAFEDVVSGLWAPYGLVSTLDYHPGFSYQYYMPDDATFAEVTSNPSFGSKYKKTKVQRVLMDNTNNKALNYNDISKAPSVRIVFTSDTSKWTRCPVLEMCDDRTQSEGNARKFHKRIHKSVDKLGRTIDDLGIAANVNDPSNPAYIDAYGMGWFPGYAISLSTGERLNILFGEDSRYVQFNGRDMIWNPVQTYMDGTQNYVMGGRHYIYVMNATNQKFVNLASSSSTASETSYITPSYDAGVWTNTMLGSLDRLMNYNDGNFPTNLPYVYKGVINGESSRFVIPVRDSAALLFASTAWVNMPLVSSRFAFKYPGQDATLNAGCASNGIPCDVTVDINVNNPYGRFFSPNGTSTAQAGVATTNGDYPKYMFELSSSIATLTGQATSSNAEKSYKEKILEAIGVVPNPYYSYSTYETLSQLETKVRFINVPAGSTISIYTLDGTLVRRLGPTTTAAHRDDNVNNPATTVDWDLHNHNGLPIAGGMYLIHVNVPEVGERVIKWFGTMRPVDLNSFQF